MHSIINGSISIKFAENFDDKTLLKLAEDINSIYLEEEGAIWGENSQHERTNLQGLKTYIDRKELIVATDKDNNILGCILLYQLNDEKHYFGMLVTLHPYRKKGLASKLIEFVEDHLKQKFITSLWIELMFSVDSKMNNKEHLRDYYTKRGFVYKETRSVADRLPQFKDIMIEEAIFEVYEKKLS